MAEKSPNNQQFKHGILAAILLVIAIAGSLGIGIGGGSLGTSCPSSSPSPCLTQVQTGTAICTIAPGTTNCSSVINFPVSYASTPIVMATSASISGNNIFIPDDILFLLPSTVSPITWIVPAAITELLGDTSRRELIATHGFSQYREVVDVVNPAPAGTKWNFQYASAGIFGPGCSGSPTWINMTEIDVSTVGYKDSLTQAFPTVAKNNVCFRAVGYGGDGISSSGYGRVTLRLISAGAIAFVCTTTVIALSTFTLQISGILAQQVTNIVQCNWIAGVPG